MITDPNNSSHWLLLARDRLKSMAGGGHCLGPDSMSPGMLRISLSNGESECR